MSADAESARSMGTTSRNWAHQLPSSSAPARATDINRYNAAGVTFPTAAMTIDNLSTFLSPTYVKSFPRRDGWGNNWSLNGDQAWGDSTRADQVYVIISYGKDGLPQSAYSGGVTTNFDCDLVYSNAVEEEMSQAGDHEFAPSFTPPPRPRDQGCPRNHARFSSLEQHPCAPR